MSPDSAIALLSAAVLVVTSVIDPGARERLEGLVVGIASGAASVVAEDAGGIGEPYEEKVFSSEVNSTWNLGCHQKQGKKERAR